MRLPQGIYAAMGVVKVTGCSLLLHMRGMRLQFTVNSGMCAVSILSLKYNVTSNLLLDWTSILQRKGQDGSKRFTETNILFMRYLHVLLA